MLRPGSEQTVTTTRSITAANPSPFPLSTPRSTPPTSTTRPSTASSLLRQSLHRPPGPLLSPSQHSPPAPPHRFPIASWKATSPQATLSLQPYRIHHQAHNTNASPLESPHTASSYSPNNHPPLPPTSATAHLPVYPSQDMTAPTTHDPSRCRPVSTHHTSSTSSFSPQTLCQSRYYHPICLFPIKLHIRLLLHKPQPHRNHLAFRMTNLHAQS